MRKVLTLLLVVLLGQAYAQTEMFREMRISKGHFRPFCRKCRAYHDIFFDKQLEYNVADSSLWFRKKEKKRFRKLQTQAPAIFIAKETALALDSLHGEFTKYKEWGEKFSVYKIELIYYSAKGQLPHKIKTMTFLYDPFIKEGEPRNLLEQVVDEYLAVIKKRK